MSKELTKEQATVEKLLPDIRATHKEFLRSGQTTVDLARQIGELLWKLKECVKKGEWQSLIEDRCEFSLRTATTYMKLSGGWELLEKKEAAATTIDGCVKLIGQARPKGGGNGSGLPKSTKSGGSNAKHTGTKPAATVGSDLSTAQPDLPPEGTVNQADQGSQGKGATGKNNEAWTPPEGVTRYNDKFEPTSEAPGLDLALKQHPYNEMLGHLTEVSRLWNLVTSDERDGVYAVDKRQRVVTLLKDIRGPIAQARPHAICDHCKGAGCKKCQNCGWWPRSVVEGLKK